MKENKRKRGRPVQEVTKDRGFRIRMSDDELAELDRLSKKTGISKTDLIRKSLSVFASVVDSIEKEN